MRWRFFNRDDLPDKSERFRRVHETFLSRALASRAVFPRIPVRRVDRGGFDSLRARPGGRDACERWWSSAFDRLDHAEC
jgi:hypothetical protein